jgi:dTDP-4-dehydrorhamnose reductase
MKKNLRKLLVTGASGFLGWMVCHQARKDWLVYGTYNSHPVGINDATTLHLDLTDYAGLKQCLKEIKPDAVIHTAAASRPDYCQKHPEESHAINVDVPADIAGLCADMDIPFVFTSSDLVFDGRHAPYKEDDPVNPVNLYGEQKALAEREILDRYPEAAVCRMPLMFGDESPAYASFFQTMVDAIKSGGELKLFTDEYRTPVSSRTAAHGLLIALEKVHGLIHLGGRERVSRYDFGVMLADVMGVTDAGLIALRQNDITLPAPRAADVSLDSSKAFALGYNPPALREELKRLFHA